MRSPANPGIFIALGSNLGDRAATFHAALAALTESSDIQVLALSSFHETEPEGGPPGQPPYLNAAAELATPLPPLALLRRMQSVEARFGRQRRQRHGPRTLDLDLLLYHALRIESAELIIPHPRMWRRAFVLTPLLEICPPERLARIRVAVEAHE